MPDLTRYKHMFVEAKNGDLYGLGSYKSCELGFLPNETKNNKVPHKFKIKSWCFDQNIIKYPISWSILRLIFIGINDQSSPFSMLPNEIIRDLIENYLFN